MLITPKKVRFSSDTMERMWDYVDKQLDYLLAESQNFREVTLPEWTRLLKGRPKQESRDFPFPNASNLVVQLIGTRVEQLLSRAMIMYGIDPLWQVSALGDIPAQESEDQARVLEQFLADMAIDPAELNLYRKEELFYHDGIAYGTSFIHFPWQYIVEQECTNISGESMGFNRADEFRDLIKKDGPSPENIPLHRILISNKETELEKARFVARIVPLCKEAIEDRIAFGVWSKEAGEKILASPDKVSMDSVEAETVASKGLQDTGNEYAAEYLIYECVFKFTHNKKTYSIIAHYHKRTRTRCTATFNFYPKNSLPFEDFRFGYDSDSYRGYGYIEMLKGYQEEVSQLHNNRLDNEAIRNTVAFRANKDSELINKLIFHPGIVIPADKDEIEPLNLGIAAMDNGQSESTSIAMTNERAGIDPAIAGNGGGIVNNKRGIYSSQGTLAVLQQQNNRTGLRMMDVKSAHTRIGRKILDLYANLGVGKRIARYGTQSEILRQALDNVKRNSIGLVIKPSTAANNVEMDRQNSILLAQLQEKYIGTINQLMQLFNQAQADESTKKFIIDSMFAEQSLARHIFRVFGHFDVDKLIPFPEAIKNVRFAENQRAQQLQQQPGMQSTGGNQNIVPVASGFGGGSIPVRT